MRNTHGFKNLATALIITLLGGLTLPAMNAAAGPIMGGGPQHSLSDHEIDFWINDGDLIEVDVPRMTEVGDVIIDGGNLNYPTPESFFTNNTMEILDDGDTVVFTIEGLNYQFDKLGTWGGQDWWNVSGDVCEWNGDMGSCTFEHIGVMVTKDFDFAEAMEVFIAEYDPEYVEVTEGKGAPIIAIIVSPGAAVAIVGVAIAVAVICITQEVTVDVGSAHVGC